MGKLNEASILDGRGSLGLSHFEAYLSPSSFILATSRGHEKLSEGFEHTQEGLVKLCVYLGKSNGGLTERIEAELFLNFPMKRSGGAQGEV